MQMLLPAILFLATCWIFVTPVRIMYKPRCGYDKWPHKAYMILQSNYMRNSRSVRHCGHMCLSQAECTHFMWYPDLTSGYYWNTGYPLVEYYNCYLYLGEYYYTDRYEPILTFAVYQFYCGWIRERLWPEGMAPVVPKL